MNTLVHNIDANEMKCQWIKDLTASDLDHLCWFSLHEHTKENGEEYDKPAAVFSVFSELDSNTKLNERKCSLNLVKDNEFEKSRIAQAARGSEHKYKALRRLTKAKKTLFLKQENSAIPIQLGPVALHLSLRLKKETLSYDSTLK